jgi:hypothetical protein
MPDAAADQRQQGVEAELTRARESTIIPSLTWISVLHDLPDDREDVAFIADCPHDENLHGRRLGGRYIADQGFGFPGQTVNASYWHRATPYPADFPFVEKTKT